MMKIYLVVFVLLLIFFLLFSTLIHKYYVYFTLGKEEQKIKTVYPPAPSGNDSLSLLTYNVWAVPFWMPWIDKVKRYGKIPRELLDVNADIVCLQEAFDPNLRRSVLKAMTAAGYNFTSEYTCTQWRYLLLESDCFGGLMTFCRYPVISEKYFPHPVSAAMKLDEKIGRKGFLVTVIKYGSEELVVVNIHLYSGRSAEAEAFRLNQLACLEKTLDSMGLNEKDIILQGDLNIVHPYIIDAKLNFPEEYGYSSVFNYLTKQMGFMDADRNVGTADITYDGLNNPYAGVFYNSNEKRQKFDYCLYRFRTRDVVQSVSATVFTAPHATSDHYGVSTQLVFHEFITE